LLPLVSDNADLLLLPTSDACISCHPGVLLLGRQ
jgi:hypothetical protein